MKWNKIRQQLQNNQTAFSGWLHIPSAWTAEVMAQAGWDCLTVDLQHGLIDMHSALSMIQAIQTTETAPLARTTWNDPAAIMKLLDMGYVGIICPMINSAEECKHFVSACRYPPAGMRSFGPTRPRVVYGNDYQTEANEGVLTLAMIETVQALDNLEDIASVSELDGVFVGTRDLRLSIAAHGTEEVAKAFDQALERVVSTMVQHGKIPGIWCPSTEAADKARQSGFTFVGVMSDSMILTEQANKLLGQLNPKK